ncbi:MAG: TRAP transporter large permease subunit [Candidatus Odyssella sp.]|nr:TRAP transporter large permease subunit [Candidatus Odyssella sp.]
MHWTEALVLLIGGVSALLALGAPVAFAFIAVNVVGAFFFLGGEVGLLQLARNMVNSVSNFAFTPIPMFLLMGDVLFHTGLAIKAIDAVSLVVRRVPARLSVIALVAGTIFSAVSGSTIATTAMLGALLLPEMLKRGYDKKLAMGPIMAIGGVDMLIPPSGLAVLLGGLSGISISGLLIGGLIPGLILSAVFIAYIVTIGWLKPELAPSDDGAKLPDGVTAPSPAVALGAFAVGAAVAVFGEWYVGLGAWVAAIAAGVLIRCLLSRGYRRWYWIVWGPTVKYVVPLVFIMFMVIGSMVLGWATPTESAAVGAAATMAYAAAFRALKRRALKEALLSTAGVTGMIMFIILGATTFSQILAFTGATSGIASVVTESGLSPTTILIGMMLLLILLGLFIDQASIMMLTVPLFMPLVKKFGFDEVWFGVMYLVCMQLGLLSPPFGLLLFTMKGVAPPDVTMGEVIRAAVPYMLFGLLLLALIFFVPPVATWLPSRV